MRPTTGRTPPKERLVNVEFRNGWKVGPYKAGQLIWQHRGWESDVIAAEYVSEAKAS